jgi:hypothetical protein
MRQPACRVVPLVEGTRVIPPRMTVKRKAAVRPTLVSIAVPHPNLLRIVAGPHGTPGGGDRRRPARDPSVAERTPTWNCTSINLSADPRAAIVRARATGEELRQLVPIMMGPTERASNGLY